MCGRLLCGRCSANKSNIPDTVFTAIGPVRTCDECHDAVEEFAKRLGSWIRRMRRRTSKHEKLLPTERERHKRRQRATQARKARGSFFDTFTSIFRASPAQSQPPESPPRAPNASPQVRPVSSAGGAVPPLLKMEDGKSDTSSYLHVTARMEGLVTDAVSAMETPTAIASPATVSSTAVSKSNTPQLAPYPPQPRSSSTTSGFTPRRTPDETTSRGRQSRLRATPAEASPLSGERTPNSAISSSSLRRRRAGGALIATSFSDGPHSKRWNGLWRLVLVDWKRRYSRRCRLANFWIWKGLAPSGRRRTNFWEVASGSRSLRKSNPGLYNELVRKSTVLLARCANDEVNRETRQAVYKIQRDVPRSMPSKEYRGFFVASAATEKGLVELSSANGKDFAGKLHLVSGNFRSLNNVLLAYCCYEGRVLSYCQGMNYIVAGLLLSFRSQLEAEKEEEDEKKGTSLEDEVMTSPLITRAHDAKGAAEQNGVPTLAGGTEDRNGRHHKSSIELADPSSPSRESVEERCFWLLVTMLDRYGIGPLYDPQSELLVNCLDKFACTARVVVPDLMAHMRQHNVMPLMYAMEWFTTAFVYSLPYDTVSRVWDLLFLRGVGVLQLVGVAILFHLRETLMACHPETILATLKRSTWHVTGDDILGTCLRMAKDPPNSALYSRACLTAQQPAVRPDDIDMQDAPDSARASVRSDAPVLVTLPRRNASRRSGLGDLFVRGGAARVENAADRRRTPSPAAAPPSTPAQERSKMDFDADAEGDNNESNGVIAL